MCARAREEHGDVLTREILEIADALCADQEAAGNSLARSDYCSV